MTLNFEISNSSVEKCSASYPEPICLQYGNSVSNVAVAVYLPTGATYESGSGDHAFVCPSVGSGTTVTCTGGALAKDDVASLILKVSAPGTAGQVSVSATVDPANLITERTKTNNTAAASVNVLAQGPRVYVGNTSGNALNVIDPGTNQIINTLQMPESTGSFVEAAGGSRLYVGDGLYNVAVIDTASNAVLANIPVATGTASPALTPDGRRVYMANPWSDSVSVLDTSTNTRIASVPVGKEPTSVAVSPDGAHAYVANIVGQSLSVIDTVSNAVSATLSLGDRQPRHVVVSPDGARVYVAMSEGNSGVFGVFDTATNTLVSTLALPDIPVSQIITPDGTHMYYFSNACAVILDLRTITVAGQLPTVCGGFSPAITAD